MTEQDKQALIKHFCSRDCGEAAKDCTIMPCHEIELIQEFPTTEADTDTISREKAIEALCAVCGKACDKSEFVYNAPQDEQVILCPEHYCLCTLPSAQPEPLSDAYTKAVLTWLLDYQIKAAKLKGRYTPYEVLSWVVNDWRKEHEGSD